MSCNKNKQTTQPQEGSISYQIVYPPQVLTQPISNLLPEKMEFYFTSNELKFKIKGDLNIFCMEFLSRAEGDSCYTLFKVINRKMVYKMEDKEMWFLFDNGASAKIQLFPDSTKTIAGFNCHLVKLQLDNSETRLKAYITQDIKINNALFRSPFGKVEGVPLEFEVVYNQLKYCFIAKNYSAGIGDERMSIPLDYEFSSKNEIRDLLDSVLQ